MAKRNTKPKRTPSNEVDEKALAKYGVSADLFKNVGGRPKGSTKYSGEELKKLFIEYISSRSKIDWKDGFGHAKRLPLSIQSFCVFLGIGESTFKDWANRTDDESFSAVIDIIKTSIKSNQIDGAVIGQYKENIIARLNGISDRIDEKQIGGFTVIVKDTDEEEEQEEE